MRCCVGRYVSPVVKRQVPSVSQHPWFWLELDFWCFCVSCWYSSSRFFSIWSVSIEEINSDIALLPQKWNRKNNNKRIKWQISKQKKKNPWSNPLPQQLPSGGFILHYLARVKKPSRFFSFAALLIWSKWLSSYVTLAPLEWVTHSSWHITVKVGIYLECADINQTKPVEAQLAVNLLAMMPEFVTLNRINNLQGSILLKQDTWTIISRVAKWQEVTLMPVSSYHNSGYDTITSFM